ncbi:CaiB/BaiF CoA transferase family protein [Actinomycetospora chibensis]|uniref:CaiB/BaiF CoA transferase family protein n=1 Tax=Actinomycetospora chibensis TaxID=663606 RepID=A0ABV9RPD3_9PSEU|nr:CoA transferase [Actinomycetospora chibensis]MDD7922322.1 CoA transferase [Actinomycetospora chibensis]
MTGPPLAGLRIVDLTQVLAGPFCTMLLADLGADVIKVEPPTGDVARRWGPSLGSDGPDGYAGYFASVNRNKRSVRLDLATEEDRATVLELIGGADVLVENFRVGVMERLGLSYEELHARFPRLVYASISGFGTPRAGASPYVDFPAFDIIAQAMGGLMSVTGADREHPMKVGPGIGDVLPAILAAFGILAAVRQAEATGEGQHVDVAMYDAVLALSERIVYQHSLTGRSPEPQGNTHPLLCPYGLVSTRDGAVAVAAPTDALWRRLAVVIGRDELGADPRYATNPARLEHARDVYAAIEQWSCARTTAEVVDALGGQVPCGPVSTAADIAVDPHVAARRMIVQIDRPGPGDRFGIVGEPVKLSGDPDPRYVRAPLLGEHNDEVLAELRDL